MNVEAIKNAFATDVYSLGITIYYLYFPEIRNFFEDSINDKEYYDEDKKNNYFQKIID